MPDETVVIAPEGQATPSANATSSAAAAATAGEGQTPEVAAKAPTLDDLIQQFGRDAILAHPEITRLLDQKAEEKATGRAGRLLEQERARLRAELKAEADRGRFEQELEQMGDAEFGAYVRQQKRIAAQMGESADDAARRAHKQMQDEIMSDLPDEKQQELRAGIASGKFKNYRELKAAVVQIESESVFATRLAQERKQWEEIERAKARQGQPRPDLPTGEPVGTGAFSSYIEAAGAHARGEITNAEMRRLKQQFGIE